METYYCKLISTEYTPSVEAQIKAFVQNTIGDVSFQPFVPYWKDSAMGELSFMFSSEQSLPEIQLMFADNWQEDTADARWSTIHCPATAFLWISL